jgi:hypothetical protein
MSQKENRTSGTIGTKAEDGAYERRAIRAGRPTELQAQLPFAFAVERTHFDTPDCHQCDDFLGRNGVEVDGDRAHIQRMRPIRQRRGVDGTRAAHQMA